MINNKGEGIRKKKKAIALPLSLSWNIKNQAPKKFSGADPIHFIDEMTDFFFCFFVFFVLSCFLLIRIADYVVRFIFFFSFLFLLFFHFGFIYNIHNLNANVKYQKKNCQNAFFFIFCLLTMNPMATNRQWRWWWWNIRQLIDCLDIHRKNEEGKKKIHERIKNG